MTWWRPAGRQVDMVVVADLDPSMGEMVSLANLCERHFVQFKVIPSYFPDPDFRA